MRIDTERHGEPLVAETAGDARVGPRANAELRERHAILERAFIDEFLAKRGYTLQSVDRLPPGDREPLLRAAATFATLKLAEIEARARLVKEIE